MPNEVESLLAKYREKYESAKRDAEFYGQMVAEIEAVMPSSQRKSKPSAAAKPSTAAAKSGRKKPLRAEVSASDAITRLLAGCKMGLPAAEIIRNVADSYGHRPNSLRTTLYNLKKKGAIVQDEGGMYNHPQNMG